MSSLHLRQRGVVLLECVGNLTANELYSPNGAGNRADAFAAIVEGVETLLPQCAGLVAVSNEVFTGGNRYAEGTEDYLRLLAQVNRALAQRADRVCEIICGLPQYYKGAAE